MEWASLCWGPAGAHLALASWAARVAPAIHMEPDQEGTLASGAQRAGGQSVGLGALAGGRVQGAHRPLPRA